jgi:hypothetical protein
MSIPCHKRSKLFVESKSQILTLNFRGSKFKNLVLTVKELRSKLVIFVSLE